MLQSNALSIAKKSLAVLLCSSLFFSFSVNAFAATKSTTSSESDIIKPSDVDYTDAVNLNYSELELWAEMNNYDATFCKPQDGFYMVIVRIPDEYNKTASIGSSILSGILGAVQGTGKAASDIIENGEDFDSDESKFKLGASAGYYGSKAAVEQYTSGIDQELYFFYKNPETDTCAFIEYSQFSKRNRETSNIKTHINNKYNKLESMDGWYEIPKRLSVFNRTSIYSFVTDGRKGYFTEMIVPVESVESKTFSDDYDTTMNILSKQGVLSVK